MTVKVLTPPLVEHITLEEARLHLRVVAEGSPPEHPDDTLILALIAAARDYCEGNLARSISPQTVEVVLDQFPDNEIQLPLPPVLSIEYLTYIDPSGDLQTLDPALYVLDNDQEPSWVLPLIDTDWPETMEVINSVRVRYTAGYTLATDSPNVRPLPAAIRAAMLLILGHLYENREAVVVGTPITAELPLAVAALLKPYQLRIPMA